MAPLVALGVDATDAARIVNALATFVLVFAAALLARAAGLSRNACLVAAIAVAVSYATLRDGALAWSEPLFCAILGVLLVVVVDEDAGSRRAVRARGSGGRPDLDAPAHAALGPLRGSRRRRGCVARVARARRRPARTAAFALALVAVPALWWARNLHVAGASSGSAPARASVPSRSSAAP